MASRLISPLSWGPPVFSIAFSVHGESCVHEALAMQSKCEAKSRELLDDCNEVCQRTWHDCVDARSPKESLVMAPQCDMISKSLQHQCGTSALSLQQHCSTTTVNLLQHCKMSATRSEPNDMNRAAQLTTVSAEREYRSHVTTARVAVWKHNSGQQNATPLDSTRRAYKAVGRKQSSAMNLRETNSSLGIHAREPLYGPSGYFAWPYSLSTAAELQRVGTISKLKHKANFGFNPSLALAPAQLKSMHAETHYLASVRHTGSQCDRFGYKDKFPKFSHVGCSVALLAENFSVLLSGPVFDESGKTVRVCEDMRFFIIDTKIFVSYMSYSRTGPRDDDYTQTWSLNQMIINTKKTNQLLDARLIDNGESGNAARLVNEGRNFGVMSERGNLVLLFWLTSPQMDVRPLLSTELATGNAEGQLIGRNGSLHKLVGRSHNLHNSINPVALPDEGLYLAVGHEHLKYRQVALFGEQYLQYFILFDMQPPYKLLYRSSPFCFPASHESLDGCSTDSACNVTCESIQFVGSIVREADDLIISYGVNDCGHRIVRIALGVILNFARRAPLP